MRRFVVSLSAATLLLVGGVIAGSAGAGSAGLPESVPPSEPGVATSEAPATTGADVASTEASATTEIASAPTQGAASTEGHPLVGAWILVDTADPDSPPFLSSFSAGGIYHQSDFDGLGGIGVWEATGRTPRR